jgi:predicted aconitase with swiveling domain
MNGLEIKCKGVVKGIAEGEALVMNHSFAFMGDVDMDTSEIIVRDHEHQGVPIAGKILIYPETKGSSGGCVVLNVMARQGKQPAAIVNIKMADYNLVEGAILANIPLVCKPEQDPTALIHTGTKVRIDANRGIIKVLE